MTYLDECIVEVDSPLHALEVVSRNIPGWGPGGAAVGPFGHEGGLAGEEVGEGLFDVGLVVVYSYFSYGEEVELDGRKEEKTHDRC